MINENVKSKAPDELAATNGSPCVVCGSPLTLGIERTVPVLMVHCNTCGSEVPWHVTQKLNLYKARGKTAASMENAPGERPGATTKKDTNAN